MAVPTWEPGTLYQPGDIVQPITAPAPTAAAVVNGDFAAGNVNWDYTGGAEFVATGGYSNNGPCVRMPGTVPDGLALNRTQLVVPSTGATFEASAMIQQGASIAGATRGWVEVRWYDVNNIQISAERGNIVSDGSGGAWKKSSLTATRPAGAAYARAGIGLFSVADHSHAIFGDNLVVSGTFAGLPDGLVYKAVQSESGFSGSSEPAWPPILGQTVVDNEVTWEAVASTRVTWVASPLYVSGATEPAWPTDIGGFVKDGTINWKTVSRRVEDPNCPDSKIVAIAASKVFAGDDDIVKYSATVNPLDWTTADDAGYLPTGLQNYGANPVSAMGLYRGNLVVFNSEAFQLWQVDEDPASMSLIDALPLGSTHHRSIAPVSNDLFFAASQGVRSIGIAASSTNYQAGDVGMPIDELVREALRVSTANQSKIMGTWFPGAGQYILGFADYPPAPIGLSGTAPNALVGRAINPVQYVVTGGVKPYGAMTVASGALPPGLALSSAGVLSGTPTVAGIYSWSVRVRDADGSAAEVQNSAIVASQATAVPIPVMVRELMFISGGGASNIASSNTRNPPWLSTITARPGDWALVHTKSWASGASSVPPDSRTIIYFASGQTGGIFVDDGWWGDVTHQAAMTAALVPVGLTQYGGTIQASPRVVVGGATNNFHQTPIFEYPANFATQYSGRTVIYRAGPELNTVVYIQYPNPASIPADAQKIQDLPGYYVTPAGVVYRVNWNLQATANS